MYIVESKVGNVHIASPEQLNVVVSINKVACMHVPPYLEGDRLLSLAEKELSFIMQ
jgi:hypothetical protein